MPDPKRELGPCPVCGQTLAKPLASCATCHTPHHADCWEYNEGCAIFGCGTKPDLPVVADARRLAVLPRLAFTALFLALFAVFAAGGGSFSVRVDDLTVDAASRVPVASWMTSPRARCLIEVMRAAEPDVVLYRRHTPAFHHHRVELAFVKPGETYLVRVSTRSGLFCSETTSQLFRTPDEGENVATAEQLPPPPPFHPPVMNAGFPPPPFPPPPFWAGAPMPPPPPPDVLPRDPFRTPAQPLKVHLREEKRAPFSHFDLRIRSHEGNISWRTKQSLLFCRVLVLRDSTLRGVERVIDATTTSGTYHRVNLEGLEPDTSYHLLVLGFPAQADPIQSPVLAFRTLP